LAEKGYISRDVKITYKSLGILIYKASKSKLPLDIHSVGVEATLSLEAEFACLMQVVCVSQAFVEWVSLLLGYNCVISTLTIMLRNEAKLDVTPDIWRLWRGRATIFWSIFEESERRYLPKIRNISCSSLMEGYRNT
jgi:hypothetical protein